MSFFFFFSLWRGGDCLRDAEEHDGTFAALLKKGNGFLEASVGIRRLRKVSAHHGKGPPKRHHDLPRGL